MNHEKQETHEEEHDVNTCQCLLAKIARYYARLGESK